MIYPHYALEVEDLTVSFDGFKAVDNFTLYVEKNELRTVIGPNGAGKTTVLDLICGTRSTKGKIRFMQHDLVGMAEQKRVGVGVGRKFQTSSIYPKLTVFENLEVSYRGRTVMGSLFFRRTSDVLDRIHEVARKFTLMMRWIPLRNY